MKYEEFIKKYGGVRVKFSSYYKYSFTFEPLRVDTGISYVTVGGNHDDIYRFELEANKEYKIQDLDVSSVMMGGDYYNFDW